MHLTLSPVRTTRKAAAAHARSASQPRHHSHPALARLDFSVGALRAWSAASGCLGGGAAAEGLALVDAVLAALGDLLATPRAASAFRDADDGVLDGFLALADAYGTFGSALIAAKQSVVEARAGVRRGDGAAVAASVRAHRRNEKEMCHLAAAMRRATAAAAPRPAGVATDTEVIDVVAEAAAVTAEASAVVFLGCAAMSRDVSAMAHTVSSRKWLARLGVVPAARKVAPETAAAAALERLEEMEECIGAVEGGSQKVFRRLLQARVLLLNIHNSL